MSAIDFAAFVDELAAASGAAILPFFRTNIGADDKNRGGMFDPVTEADKAAESILRQMIRRAFPDHGIVGEEFGDHVGKSDYTWVLDPIDGTKSFISGMPTWGTLIGLENKGRPVYGMMHQPFTRERFTGDGRSALWRGPGVNGEAARRSLRVRACAGLNVATLMSTSPLLLSPGTHEGFARVEREVRLSRYGGDCYCYCMLAAGQIDLVVESGLKPYDIAALVPIVEGAGGIVSDWQGGPAAKGGAIIAAGDRRVYEAAMKLLA